MVRHTRKLQQVYRPHSKWTYKLGEGAASWAVQPLDFTWQSGSSCDLTTKTSSFLNMRIPRAPWSFLSNPQFFFAIPLRLPSNSTSRFINPESTVIAMNSCNVKKSSSSCYSGGRDISWTTEKHFRPIRIRIFGALWKWTNLEWSNRWITLVIWAITGISVVFNTKIRLGSIMGNAKITFNNGQLDWRPGYQHRKMYSHLYFLKPKALLLSR